MNFQKIKYDAGKKSVELKWIEIKDSGTEIEHTMRSSEEPAPELAQALDLFVPHVLRLLELPKSYSDGFVVQSLSINEEEKDGRLGLVVTCLKTLADTKAPLVLNTPHQREPMDSADEGAGFFSRDFAGALSEAQQAAWAFVTGKRAQGELFAAAEQEE